jgi:hypothetical protein
MHHFKNWVRGASVATAWQVGASAMLSGLTVGNEKVWCWGVFQCRTYIKSFVKMGQLVQRFGNSLKHTHSSSQTHARARTHAHAHTTRWFYRPTLKLALRSTKGRHVCKVMLIPVCDLVSANIPSPDFHEIL